MWHFLVSWLVNAFALYILARLLPAVTIENLVPADGGLITWQGFVTLMFASLILGILNAVIKPLLNLLALPITILTLGLFTLVITGFVFWLATVIVPGFSVAGFGWAIIAGLLLGLINWVLNMVFGTDRQTYTYAS